MKVLITGANGFIGQALFQALQSNDIAVRAAVRDATTSRLACSSQSEVLQSAISAQRLIGRAVLPVSPVWFTVRHGLM
jgi:nucleoside-diphosphate-sugar epimerase